MPTKKQSAEPADLQALTAAIIQFRDARDWGQFHNPKDVAISISLEANELLEHFQWKSPSEIERYISGHKSEIAEEAADVLLYLLQFCHDLQIDLVGAGFTKLRKSEQKYPVAKARGNHKKYTELDHQEGK